MSPYSILKNCNENHNNANPPLHLVSHDATKSVIDKRMIDAKNSSEFRRVLQLCLSSAH